MNNDERIAVLSIAEHTNGCASEAVPPPRSPTSQISLSEFMTSYLTCSRCNYVNFVNITRIRTKTDPKEQNLDLYEKVPFCEGCGSTRYLRPGIVSFKQKILEEQQSTREFEEKKIPVTISIQRFARGFLSRLALKRLKEEKEAYLRKLYLSATKIQCHIRGVQGRRRCFIERCLCIIKGMHPSVLKWALTQRQNEPPVFWYENINELRVFFWDYREFVRRSGRRPTLIKVESNILEITKRVLQREYELASRIQALWKGITTRSIFVELKRQKAWLKSIQQSPAIKIQRLFKKHQAIKRCKTIKLVRQYPIQKEIYKKEMRKRKEQKPMKDFRDNLLAKYKVEYQLHKTERMLGLFLPKIEDDSNSNNSTGSSNFSLKQEKRNQQHGDPFDANHPKSKFAEMKNYMDIKKNRLRGPILHIIKSKQYTVASSSAERTTKERE